MKQENAPVESTGDHATDRRHFLKQAGTLLGLGLGACFAGLPGTLAAARMPGSGANSSPSSLDRGAVRLGRRRLTLLDALNLNAFRGQLNSTFVFDTPEGRVEMRLVEASDLLAGKANPAPVAECFSLVFQGSVTRPVEQGTYRVDHSRLGSFDLFIVPIRQTGRTRDYQAIFNRIAG